MNKIQIIRHYPYQIHYQKNSNVPKRWLLLHGFMGSWHDFDDIITQLPGEVLALNLLGFGNQAPTIDDCQRFTMSEQIKDLTMILDKYQWSQVTILGYSMGGRLALGFALTHPQRVSQLLLESTTAGIDSVTARQQRQQADLTKAISLLDNFEAFVLRWEKLPLFKTQQDMPLESKQKMRRQRMAQNPKNVAQALIYMGTGSQPNYWPYLDKVDFPTTIIVGEHDQKFNLIGDKMMALIPQAKKIVIAGAGHNVHFEQPKAFIEAMQYV